MRDLTDIIRALSCRTTANCQICNSYSFPSIFFLWSFPFFDLCSFICCLQFLFPPWNLTATKDRTQSSFFCFAPISALASAKGMKWASQALGHSLCSVGMEIMLGFWVHGIEFWKQWFPWAWRSFQYRGNTGTPVKSPCRVLKRCSEREFQQTERLSNPLPLLPCLPGSLKNTDIRNKTTLSLFWETTLWNISSNRTCRTQLSIQFHWEGKITFSVPWFP